MRIDVLGLEAFLGIATHGSFNSAAAHLNLSQTALSQRLEKLEDDLGVTLLARSTRRVTLTAAGAELLPMAQRLVEEMTRSLDGLRAAGRGRPDQFAIVCLPTIAKHCLPRVLREFERMQPGVGVRIFNNSASEIVERVRNGEAEFGVTIASTGRWDLDVTPLLEEAFVLVCPADHPLTAQPCVAWSELEGVPLIRISAQTGTRVLIDELTWTYEVKHVGTAIGMVQAGVGLTVVPRLGIDPGVAAVPLKNPSVARSIGLVTHRDRPLTPAAAALARLVMASLRTGGLISGPERTTASPPRPAGVDGGNPPCRLHGHRQGAHRRTRDQPTTARYAQSRTHRWPGSSPPRACQNALRLGRGSAGRAGTGRPRLRNGAAAIPAGRTGSGIGPQLARGEVPRLRGTA